MDYFLDSFLQRGARYDQPGGGGGPPGSSWPNFQRAQEEFVRNVAGVMDPQNETSGPKGAPPASKRAVRQLPTVVVKPEDLVDESNRECCICLEENHLKDRVIRLPCAHIFHQPCIVDWLNRHCTCPVCRYELPTDDPEYEKTRVERMKHRKPRYARYELDRMSVHDLRSLASRLRVDITGVAEKGELVGRIVESGRIDVIASPEPVEHLLSELRAMGVGKLRRVMEAAGVFFDPVDVVEKEDMVRIFVNSGRVVLLPEEPDQDESVVDGGDGVDEKMEGVDEKVEGEKDGATAIGAQEALEADGNKTEPIVVEDVTDDEDNATERDEVGGPDQEGTVLEPVGEDGSSACPTPPPSSATSAAVEPQPSASSSTQQADTSQRQSAFANRSVSELRALARELNVNISDCIEKSEMVRRVGDAATASSSHSSSY